MQRKITWASVVVVSLAMSGIANGSGVYKCVDAKGAITFQQIACSPGVRGVQVKLRSEPPVPPSALPSGAFASSGAALPSFTPTRANVDPPFAPSSPDSARARGFECRTAAGVTFYRVDECPRSLVVGSTPAYSAGGQLHGGVPINMPVTSREISNSEACNKMGRQPMRYDTVSSYDRRNGKDPCR